MQHETETSAKVIFGRDGIHFGCPGILVEAWGFSGERGSILFAPGALTARERGHLTIGMEVKQTMVCGPDGSLSVPGDWAEVNPPEPGGGLVGRRWVGPWHFRRV